jgi:hypothetical protein
LPERCNREALDFCTRSTGEKKTGEEYQWEAGCDGIREIAESILASKDKHPSLGGRFWRQICRAMVGLM